MGVVAKVWKVRGPLLGHVSKDDFTFHEETLPDPKDGEFLAEAVYLTVDPYMKGFAFQHKSGEVMSSIYGGLANQVARVIESKNENFPVGTLVLNSQGWRTHFVSDGTFASIEPDFGDLSPSHALGALGMPGLTAYCSLMDVCQPKAGEVVVVNAAAGAVGYLIVQIGKAVGCKMIAYAGTDEKCAWLKELGADYVYNYKKTNLADTLKEAAPDGVDCFIDHVGGTTFATVLSTVRKGGRICIVGEISQYNKTPEQRDRIDFNSMYIIVNEITIKGFISSSYQQRAGEVVAQMLKLNKEGKVKFRERIVDGFENMLDAFLSLFTGQDNFGKVIIKV
ncbi:prostaglandin reductase 1-like [Lineus longissimus]|uniref:prostaglandin reductase 1-like n=1 Tax=Lineus longissimus TaxID=88925 RepID=UPI002B4E1963